MAPHETTALVLGGASLLVLVLAWMIGVGGKASLITNYRLHPERYPDVAGLTSWIGRTLALGGISLGICALAYATHAIGKQELGWWAGGTAAVVVGLAFLGLARYRRMPKDKRGS
jgi:peptidoglycan/LPS O-acetylase OafA/YrhL